MKRTRKLVTVAVLAVAVVVSAITAAYALSANTTETYAYLPEHSVYFYDTAGEYAWASREVDTLAVAGVIKGGGTHLFYPGNAITRADFIVMLDRAYGMSEALDNGQVNSNGSFVDVPSSAYYSKAVIAAKAFIGGFFSACAKSGAKSRNTAAMRNKFMRIISKKILM